MMTNKIKNIQRKGRGVFARKNFQTKDTIEECELLILSEEDTKKIQKTQLDNYYYEWGKNFKSSAIALGHGSLYNHSSTPNAIYKLNQSKKTISFIAIKKIKKEEEITVNYHGKPNIDEPCWFDLDIPQHEWAKTDYNIKSTNN